MNPWTHTSRRYLRYAVYTVATIYAVNFGLLAFLLGPFDYDHLSGYYEIAWRFWRSNFGIPHFNPYLCGGRTLGGDPQLPIFHPFVLLVPLIGPTMVLKWEMLAAAALGTWALWRVLARFEISEDGRWWGVLLWMAGGGIVARFMVGHNPLAFYFLYPLFLHLSYQIDEQRRWGKPFVLYALLFIYSGLYKPNFLIYGAPPLFLEAAARAILKKRVRVFAAFIAALGIGTLIDAVTYLPAWKYFSTYPRLKESEALFVPPYSLLANLLFPLKAVPEALYGSVFRQRHEYNVFLGPLALYFAWLGRKRLSPELTALVVMAVFSAWIGFGSFDEGLSPFSSFSWFRAAWPGFNSIRVPMRFWFGVALVILVLSARGFRVPDTFGKWQLFLWIGLLPLLGNAGVNLFKTTVLAHGTQFSPARSYPPKIVLERNEHPDYSYATLREGKGVVNCVENIETFTPPDLEAEDMLKVTTRDMALIEAEWNGWHRIRLYAEGEKSIELTLNFNHHDYWRFEGGDARIVSQRGERIRVTSPSGKIDGELVFEQPLAKAAAATSLVSLLLFVALAVILTRCARPG